MVQLIQTIFKFDIWNYHYMTETELNNGEIYIYKDQYETMEVIVSFSRTLEGSKAFKIRLNDKPVIISKDFICIENKLRELISKHRLLE
ncbi:hypothetical protein MAR621_03688 [Maribacter dokdonensis]|nr:hypothetical protein MAR621_03688 [Maribacter dokdonensis]